MKDGHRILFGNHVKTPTKVLTWDPCHFGQPMMLIVADVSRVPASVVLTMASWYFVASLRPSLFEQTEV